MKTQRTLRQFLVHTMDSCSVGDVAECVYEIPFNNCNSLTSEKRVEILEKGRRNTGHSGAGEFKPGQAVRLATL